MITARILSATDDLQAVIDDINNAAWDDANDMGIYHLNALADYLSCEGTIFVVCYQIGQQHTTFLGMASGRIERKPYDATRWLYVDEVDVCADQRQKGAGRAMMNTLLQWGWSNDCTEVWLGTEQDNAAANALYRSLAPAEIARFVGFTWAP